MSGEIAPSWLEIAEIDLSSEREVRFNTKKYIDELLLWPNSNYRNVNKFLLEQYMSDDKKVMLRDYMDAVESIFEQKKKPTWADIKKRISLLVWFNLLMEKILDNRSLEVSQWTMEITQDWYTCLVRKWIHRCMVKNSVMYPIDQHALKSEEKSILQEEKPEYSFPYTNNYPFKYNWSIYMIEHKNNTSWRCDEIEKSQFAWVKADIE